MTQVKVCGVLDVHHVLSGEHDIVAILSIEDPEGPAQGLQAPRIKHVSQHILQFRDTSDPDHPEAPEFEHIEQGIEFVKEHIVHGTVLIHCQFGLSRSTAMALAVLANIVAPHKDEDSLIEHLHDIRPGAAPNALMVEFVDQLSGRQGKLVEAVDNHPVVQEIRSAFPNHVAPAKKKVKLGQLNG